jgi:predicted aminopeptidase
MLLSDYAAVKMKWGGNAEYDAWFAQPLNNAALAAVATYTRWVPILRARLESHGLDAFYADTAALAKLKNEERAEQLRSWGATSVSASE